MKRVQNNFLRQVKIWMDFLYADFKVNSGSLKENIFTLFLVLAQSIFSLTYMRLKI